MFLRLSSMGALGWVGLFACSAFVACSNNAGDDGAGGAATTSTTTTGAGGQGAGGNGAGNGGAAPTPTQRTLSGDITWQVTFDATAQAAGATDCSYTRHYQAVEDTSAAWLCPSCEVLFRADVQMTSGQSNCYTQVSTAAPSPTEWIGYSNGAFWRSAQGPTTQQGTSALAAATLTMANTVTDQDAPAGGKLSFAVSGSLTLGVQDGDPRNGFIPPPSYACGWPKGDAVAYGGDYLLANGAVVPDGLFKDKCGETVRLHDFAGKPMLIDMAAMDCGPCQLMAGDEEQLVANLAAKGIDLQIITLLCPSLTDVFGNTTTANLTTWIHQFSLSTAVLADRGWGVAIFEPAIGTANIGYPAWAVVDASLHVRTFGVGYGTLAEMQAAIETALQ